MTCGQLDPLVTAYVDGELSALETATVAAHLRSCPSCHSRIGAERIVHETLRERRGDLRKELAPAGLRARCALSATVMAPAPGTASNPLGSPRRWLPSWLPSRPSRRVRSLALAAGLVLVVGGTSLYEMTGRSTRVMAAELTADHLKCFAVNRVLGTHQDPTAVERALTSHFGASLRLPEQPERAGLELVGERPCLYGQGRVAHIMYRHRGNPVSVFMLPGTMRSSEFLDVLGHEAAIWSAGGRTFVLIAREPRVEIERMASFVHASLR